MRLLLIALCAGTLAPAAAAPAAQPGSSHPSIGVVDPNSWQSKDCPRARGSLADRSGPSADRPLAPQKLTQLPPGTTYMAVYRRIGGCEAPLTMSDYRSPRGR